MIIFLVVFWFLFITLVIYGIILLLTVLFEKLLNKDKTIDFKRSKQYRSFVTILSFVIGILLNIWYLSYNPAHNFKTAYIEKKDDKYVITILWKGNLMVHDPISLLEKKTYIDSQKFVIPRANGIIDGLEINNDSGSYKILKGEAIKINNNKMKVHIFYDNYDDKKID